MKYKLNLYIAYIKWNLYKTALKVKTSLTFFGEWFYQYVYIWKHVFRAKVTWSDSWLVFKLLSFGIIKSFVDALELTINKHEYYLGMQENIAEHGQVHLLSWYHVAYKTIRQYEMQNKVSQVSELYLMLGGGRTIEGEFHATQA